VFDRFVVVDWSANSAPKLGRDSIWIAQLDAGGGDSVTNLPTRRSAEMVIAGICAAGADTTTLIAVDFSLGYPVGTAAALGLEGMPWSSTWALLTTRVVDDGRNANNRFAVAAELNRRLTATAAPFWGCPPSAAGEYLAPTKAPVPPSLAAFRACEQVLRGQGRRPFSSWQLLGAGAVGSQSLLGIPMLERLRHRFVDRVDVWPFTTGFRPPDLDAGAIVIAEIWPSMRELGDHGAMVRDAAQVSATATWLVARDGAGELAALFSPTMSPEVEAAALVEEGWVLGVMP
jgi:precorrin-8X/cobalt-precorrin-8 methylmutase